MSVSTRHPSTLIFTSAGLYLGAMPQTEPSESEKQYRGFQIHIEGGS
jgi:hypothetical protein